VLPKALAHIYIRLTGKADSYYETHLSYWGLKALVRDFNISDYTLKTISEAEKYGTEYMVRRGSLKALLATALLKYCYWASPGYIWLLEKPV